MINIEWIIERVRTGNYELTAHAEHEREADKIIMENLEMAILNGEILEDYPEDPRGISCLVSGYGKEGFPIHIICGKTKNNNLRTIYIPTLPKWIDPRTRRKRNE